MPTHPFAPLRGRLETIHVRSAALADNCTGDPDTRAVAVYLPEGYDEATEDYPLLVDLVGFTGSGLAHVGWKAFAESVPHRIDRLVAAGRMGPVICAFPDCFTSLGGNQYINSSALGRWADYLTGDMMGALQNRFRVRPGPQHRACFGKSSGGYGSIVHGMRYAQHWGAVACHSGDMGFDRIYLSGFPDALDALAKHGGVAGFMEYLGQQNRVEGQAFHVLMTLAMAATYDPDPTAPMGVRLPVDPRTCVLDRDAWARWLTHDPVVMVELPEIQANLRSLSGLFIDCGFRDQYAIHYGSRQLTDRLEALGIAHVYEEFDDTHSGIDYRMDRSLPFLYAAITGAALPAAD